VATTSGERTESATDPAAGSTTTHSLTRPVKETTGTYPVEVADGETIEISKGLITVTSDASDLLHPDEATSALWRPDKRCCQWLLIGIVALLADLVLGIISTVLQFQHWDQEGFTSSDAVDVVALAPQLLIAAAYLVLAREAGARGLWKSAAGMLGSYLLMYFLGVVMLEVLSDAWNTAIMVTTAMGLLGLLAFSISGLPRFVKQPDNNDSPTASTQESESSSGIGFMGHLGAFVFFIMLRGIFRRFIRPMLGGGFGPDDWVMIEFFAVLAVGLSFAVWFAVTKIGLHKKLGSMARVLGSTEILILLLHVGLAVIVFAAIISEAAANPQLDDDAIDQLLTPWMKRGTLISTSCHVIWVALTAVFFASLRKRGEQDWPGSLDASS
jgi:hypothetical protein